jgi:redox-sensitive bicupin YhaK (pirin superfamily)
MEIMTYVISGALEHRDSMGNRGVLRAGDVQRMTAGTGIFHSEYNHSGEEPVHFLQIWFEPDRLNLPPSYEQKSFALEAMENRLLPVVSGKGAEGALPIHQDVTVYLSRLAAGRELEFEQEKGRRIYLFVIEGTLQVEEETLHPGDSARITDLHRLTLKSGTDAHFMLMDLA